jgi:two-component system, cell cycle sensor histidine kinase and response regulator CckA
MNSMTTFIIPLSSVALQFWAAFLALRLMVVTRIAVSWLLVSAAILLMACHRCLSLYDRMSDPQPPLPLEITSNLLGLTISALLVLGLLTISPLFQALKRRADLLHQQHAIILDTAGEGIFGLDPEGKVTFVNPAAVELTGYQVEELLGRRVHDLLHHVRSDGSPYDFEDCPIRASLKDGKTRQVADEVFWRKDGAVLPVAYTATPTVINNRVLSATVVFKDAATWKKTEADLRVREEHYRALITNAMDLISIITPEGDFKYISPSLKRILGYQPEDMIGRNCFDFIHPDDQEWVRGLLGEMIQADRAMRVGEFRFRHRNGSWRILESIGKNLLSHATIDGIVVNSREVTERRQAEMRQLVSLERQNRLNRLQQDLLASGTMVQKLKMITDGVVDIFGADFCRIWVIAPGDLCDRGCVHAPVEEGPHACRHKDRCLHLLASSGRYTHTDGGHRRVPFGAYKIGRVASGEDHKFLTNDVTHDPRVHNHDWARELGLVSFAGYQLRPPDGQTLGVLALFKKSPINPEEDAQLDFLGGTAAQVIHGSRAEEALRQSEAKYRNIFENAAIGIFQSTPAGRFLSVNPAIAQTLGYDSPQELLSSIHDIGAQIYPDPAERTAIWRRLEKGPGPLKLEQAFRRKDGEITWWNLIISPVRDVDGQILYVEGFVEDITERKRAQEQLAQSERRYRQLVELSPDAIFIQVDGHITYINAAGLRLLAASRPEEILGRRVLDLVHPDFREIVARRMEIMQDGRTAVSRLEQQYISLSGEVVDVEVAAAPLVFQGKNGAQVVMHDISKRKRNMAQIENLAKFPSEDPSPVLRIAGDGAILYANPSSAPLLHLWGCRIGHALPQDLQAFVREALESGLSHRLEVECQERIYVLNLTPITDRGYVNIYGQDVTERKKAEKDLRETEEQLRQSQKMEAVGRLAGGVAHDFNNILTAISGYAELLLLDPKRVEPLLQEVQEIQQAAERAKSLTRQLLAFSRKQVLQPLRLDLNTVVGKLHLMLQRLLGEDIDLKIFLGPDLGAVTADPGQLEQVIVNLAVNARDSMPDGGKLTIATSAVTLDGDYAQHHAEVEPGPYVLLAVSDSGVGMDKETQARIFEPFFTTKEPGQGTGLGLSMVYGIVKQSGGHIWVYSEVGRGTTFKVYLPRTLQPQETVSTQPPAEDESEISGTILLVEDEEMVRRVTCRMLEIKGFTVLTADGGRAALALSEQHPEPIDLLLTDVMMPEIGGLKLAESLLPQRPGMRVLFMSGHTEGAIVHQGILDPGIAFIQKPFKMADLIRKIREVLTSDRGLNPPPGRLDGEAPAPAAPVGLSLDRSHQA